MTVALSMSSEPREIDPSSLRLRELVQERFARSAAASETFFDSHADRIGRACLEMATRFQRGGRLLAFGVGAETTDAHHVAVEFVHPVIVGKRALPAIALSSDVAALTGASRHAFDDAFARTLSVLARPNDIALAISRAEPEAAIVRALRVARERGLLTIEVRGRGITSASADDADFAFIVPSDDPMVVQEVQETLYHVLWELVHVFFEHGVAA